MKTRLNKFVITGASSGLGMALARELTEGWHRDVIGLDLNQPRQRVTYPVWALDLAQPEWVRAQAEELAKDYAPDCLVNCAGVSHQDWLENTTADDFDRVMAVNARAPFLLAKGLLPALQGGGTICNIISNASHVPMTASLAYNASKGALHIMTLQLARELTKRHGITVFGVSPNKMEGTGMSHYIEERVVAVRGMTAEAARAYQLAALPTGQETRPESVAQFLAWLLVEKERHSQLSGTVLPYGG